jgi:hypothetical protein
MNFREIIKIYISDNYSLNVEFGIVTLGLIVLVIFIIFIKTLTGKKKIFLKNDIELNIGLGGIGNLKIKPNYAVEQIVHKAWTELITRKAGLQIDPENDVIVEVYNSWYVLFGEMRSLIKEIPANKIQNKETQKVVNLLIDSLNQGLRPHLTKWQAKFRKWYEYKLGLNQDESPQQIQKQYPQYDELMRDLILINQQLVSYTNELKKIIS